MEKRPPIISFGLFLEEFLRWSPGEINTIFERLALIAMRSSEDPQLLGEAGSIIQLINPAISIFLFMISAGAMVRFLKSSLLAHVSPQTIIFFNRYPIIQHAISGAVAIWIILQVTQALSPDSAITMMDLYQNKFLWTILFGGMIAYNFTSRTD